jgi:prevent-host-death family protein
MQITTKELRIQPGRIIDQVANGQEVTVTFRGKALAKIIPIRKRSNDNQTEESSIFGLWKDHENFQPVEDFVGNLRKGRFF